MEFKKTASIYVAGHRGLVGSAIVRRLKAKGRNDLLLMRSNQLDLRRQEDVEAFFSRTRPRYVFLAAARVGGIHANDTYPADFIRDNLQIQTNVIDASWRFGVKKLLFLGSSCIYPKYAKQPMREEYLLTGPLEPTNEWYAVAKIAGIKMCQAYRRQYGFNAICLMPTNLYGTHDNFDLETSHVLPAMMRKFHLARLVESGNLDGVARDEELFGRIPEDILIHLGLVRTGTGTLVRLSDTMPRVMLWGSGAPRREFLHVDDLADACVYLMENYDEDEIINVGCGQDLTIRELAGIIRDVVGFHGETVWDASKPDGTPRKLLSVERLESLGWRPHLSLKEGIRMTYRWYLSRYGEEGQSAAR